MNAETVRAANTETLVALNRSSVDKGHVHVLDQELIDRLAPEGVHLCWGTFPHEQETTIVRRGGDGDPSLPSEIPFHNGSPGSPGKPHLRTVWLLSVTDGDPAEGIIHLDYAQVVALAEYERPADSGYPPISD